MAIAKISHVRVVGLKRDQNKIIDKLTANGLFEARATDALFVGETENDASDAYKELKLKQSKIAFALDFLKARHVWMRALLDENSHAVKKGKAEPIDYTLSAEKYSSGRMLITKADFSDAAAKEYELLHVCDELQKISFDMADATSRTNALKSMAQAYRPYAALPFKFSELRRGGVVISVYYGVASASPEQTLAELPCAFDILRDNGMIVITVTQSAEVERIDKAMSALGYSVCPFDDDCTAEQKLKAFESETADVKRHIFELTKNALAYEKYVKELRILYDCIELDIERSEAERKFIKTDSTFVLEGWLPESVAQSTVDGLTEICPSVFVQLLAPEEKDEPPTLVVNNKVVKPYEDITNMYSPPKYGEIDPNPIMSIFYFLFFGIMIGDAAYGLVLAVAGLVIGMSKKFDTGFKRLALLVGMGGISAVIWGVIFGGYFSIDFGDAQIALWFNPLDDPMTMLILSVVLGCVQMVVGYGVKFVALCKEGKPFSAIFDAGSIIILFGALGCLAVNMFLLETSVFGLTVATIVLAALGVCLILFFGGRNSKNIFGKALGGFKGLYGLVNLLSDVLSYCRLFGLGLASCAIGLAFNSLGGILFEIPYVGYVIGVIILIPLHAFNLGIGVLSAYVHDARLQFLEFYGKFYEGGGRLFAPLGSRTKYIRYN